MEMVGNIVHECMEMFLKGKSEGEMKAFFDAQWEEKNLHRVRGLNGKVLDKNKYWFSVLHGMSLFDTKYEKEGAVAEEEFIFPLIDKVYEVPNEKGIMEKIRYVINIKGYADVQANLKGTNERALMDYKTSSAVDKGENFKRQALHYLYSMYMKRKEYVKKAFFEYIKIRKSPDPYVFSLMDFRNYHEDLKNLADEIIKKGLDINNYSIGNVDGIFNPFKKACREERARRKKVDKFTIEIRNNKINFTEGIFEHKDFRKLKLAINNKYKYKVDGCEWSPRYQARQWDGFKRFLKNNTLPLGFIGEFLKLFDDYVSYYKLKHKISVIDSRDKNVLFKSYSTQFKDSPIKLRYYQNDAIEACLDKKIGILYGGTGFGKSLTSAELIKKINMRTLIITNRNELIYQTAEVYREYMGVPIGVMTEGKLVTDKQIIVASIQTINSIVEGKDKIKAKQLKAYLYNVNVVITDEAQFVSSLNSFGNIDKYTCNAEYKIGLSGSPWRNGSDTLELNAVVGFPIYEKSTKELEKEGFLVPTKCLFYKNTLEIPTNAEVEKYSDAYRNVIAFNKDRNKFVLDLINKNKDKKFMIITKLVEHSQELKELIENSEVITGSIAMKDRKDILGRFKEGNFNVLIGTQQILSTGLDIPSCDVMCNMTANKSDIMTVQSIGRVKRKAPGKLVSYFIDFNDESIKWFSSASKVRKKILKAFGNEIEEITSVPNLK